MHGRNDSTTPFDYEYTNFVYQAFDFERVIYLYVWEILVGMTLIVNLFVSFVLTRKALRNATNMLLVAIAISDTLTGLVTLPSYIMVYANYQSADDHADVEDFGYDYADYLENNNLTFFGGEIEEVDAFLLSKPVCEAFMLSKFYIAKVFHTISIWLTLYLGIQRFVRIKYPFATRLWFAKKTNIIVGICIVIAAPILHIYHVIKGKTVDGACVWAIEKPCTGSCAHMMATLLLMHVIPCTVLIFTTVMMVCHLQSRINSENDQQAEENRRVSKIVIAIVVVFLISEVPYAMFLVYLQILAHTELRSTNSLQFNRAAHAFYEICVVLSFNANFYIYTFLNRRFRRKLRELCTCMIGQISESPRTSVSCEQGTVQLLTVTGTGNDVEMTTQNCHLKTNETESSATMETPNAHL